MDANDLKNLHRATDQSSTGRGDSFNPNLHNKYAVKWCGDIDKPEETGDFKLDTADLGRVKHTLAEDFPTFDTTLVSETELCKFFSEKIFAPIFTDWNGCRLDYVNINGRPQVSLVLSFTEGGSGMFANIQKAETAFAAIEKRNSKLNDYAYDQIVTKNRFMFGNKTSNYVLTTEAKKLLSNYFFNQIEGSKRVNNEKQIIWRQPNWDKYIREEVRNNAVASFAGFSNNFSNIVLTVKGIDPAKCLDLFYAKCMNADVDAYFDALDKGDKKEAKKLSCIREIVLDRNPRQTKNGWERMVTIKTMSAKDADVIMNTVNNVNRPISNGPIFY